MSNKLLIFDWDGTLVDSSDVIIKSIQHAASECNLDIPPRKDIFDLWGMTLRGIVDTLFPGINYAKFAECYHKNYAEHNSEAILFEGVYEGLQMLRKQGYLMAIATNKVRSEPVSLLHKWGLYDFFRTMRCGDDAIIKPDPNVILSILEELSVIPSAAIMVGDTKFDMLTAQRAGVDALAVGYGVGRAEVLKKLLLYNPKDVIYNFRDLLGCLRLRFGFGT